MLVEVGYARVDRVFRPDRGRRVYEAGSGRERVSGTASRALLWLACGLPRMGQLLASSKVDHGDHPDDHFCSLFRHFFELFVFLDLFRRLLPSLSGA